MQTYIPTKSRHQFVKCLLKDVESMEYMLANDWFESDITRIGAEQEIVLIDKDTYRPSTLGPEILEKTKEEKWLVSELAKFNLELNLDPQVFEKNCLRLMEAELKNNLKTLRGYLSEFDIDYILTGILPTLHKYHLDFENLTPKQRYKDLMHAIKSQLRAKSFELRLVGIDELLVRHDSALLEACNTSFQVHLQVAPNDFVDYYNYALALTAPCISMAANSPIVFGKRLWHETRIALFQQAIDTRKTLDHMRQMSPRVILGETWLDGDVTQIFKDDIARFKILLHADLEEDSMEMIRKNKVPKLKSLQLHNSTVYRWNRPCYGISDTGKPHLRIENRVLPSGPTVIDEMANTAFWLGAMKGMAKYYPDIRNHMSFADVRDNFGKASRFGIDTKFTWTKDQKITVRELMLKELIPMSREGLRDMKVNKKDITRYLDVVEERMESHMNGARWMLRSFTRLKEDASSIDEALTNLTASIHKNQNIEDYPVHKWEESDEQFLPSYNVDNLRVSEFMQTDLFSVEKKDLVPLVAKLMSWKDISYMPVEDKKGRLVGLLSAKNVLSKLMSENKKKRKTDLVVKDIMIIDPPTISPEATLRSATQLMKEQGVGCLPVVKSKELVGIITEHNIIKVTSRILKK